MLDREDDDGKGLALLLVKSSYRSLSGVTSLKLGSTADLGNGEIVRVIGFPNGTNLWTVETGNIKRLQGRNLILSGVIREGESGGPVILNQEVIGLVTDVGQGDAYATRAENIITYVNGIVRNLINLGPQNSNSASTPKDRPVSEPSNALIDVLKGTRWLEHDVTIKGEKVYLEFEPNGRVRTRTASDSKGYVASNVKWHIDGRTLYMQQFDLDTKTVVVECNGTLQGNRIEGQFKRLTTGKSSKWLLTRVE